MRATAIGTLAALSFVAVLTHAQPAQAGGVIIYHSGEDVFPTGPLPEPFANEPRLKGGESAYMCNIFGLFWAYFHDWNCRPVAVKGQTVFTDADIAKAVGAKYTEADMQIGLWTKHGRWIFAAVGVFIVIGWIRGRRDDDDEDDDDAAESDDDYDDDDEDK